MRSLVVDVTAGTLVYPSPGVLIQEGEFDDPQPILFAHQTAPDTLDMRMISGQDAPYTIDPSTLQSYNAGIVKFQDSTGTSFQIRPFADTDGEWLSRYQTAVPALALRNMVSGYNNTEGTYMSSYLNDQRETMVAFQFPGDNFLFGLLYINRFGAYIRLDGSWVMVPHNDDTFDETYPYYVNPDSVDDFLTAWDQGPVAVDDAQANNWITAPTADDGSDTTTPADQPDDGSDQINPEDQNTNSDLIDDNNDQPDEEDQ